MQLGERGVIETAGGKENERLRHWSPAVPRRLEENRMRPVAAGLFQYRYNFGRLGGCDEVVDPYEAVDDGASSVGPNVEQPTRIRFTA
jgi:hypothetical protein